MGEGRQCLDGIKKGRGGLAEGGGLGRGHKKEGKLGKN